LVLVELNTMIALRLAHAACVRGAGRIAVKSEAAAIARGEYVAKAYLGC
jgi:ABC-type branched-subunit amino acid transport system ATPase component